MIFPVPAVCVYGWDGNTNVCGGGRLGNRPLYSEGTGYGTRVLVMA
jgi:hypothetical protein